MVSDILRHSYGFCVHVNVIIWRYLTSLGGGGMSLAYCVIGVYMWPLSPCERFPVKFTSLGDGLWLLRLKYGPFPPVSAGLRRDSEDVCNKIYLERARVRMCMCMCVFWREKKKTVCQPAPPSLSLILSSPYIIPSSWLGSSRELTRLCVRGGEWSSLRP